MSAIYRRIVALPLSQVEGFAEGVNGKRWCPMFAELVRVGFDNAGPGFHNSL